jgi:hypothetical protein
VFCKKSPQTIENKGREVAKESKEIPRVRNLLKRNGLQDFVCAGMAEETGGTTLERGHPRGFCINMKGKGLWEKGFVSVWKERICKSIRVEEGFVSA